MLVSLAGLLLYGAHKWRSYMVVIWWSYGGNYGGPIFPQDCPSGSLSKAKATRIYSLMGMNNIEQIINNLFHIFDRWRNENNIMIDNHNTDAFDRALFHSNEFCRIVFFFFPQRQKWQHWLPGVSFGHPPDNGRLCWGEAQMAGLILSFSNSFLFYLFYGFKHV